MSAVTVIIVNFNSGSRLLKAIARLKQQTFADFDVIVFDNASADRSAEWIDAGSLRLRTIMSKSNMGFAAANNAAARETASHWLAFLNPDAYAEPEWLAALMAAAARYPDVDAFGSTQIDAKNASRLDGAGDAYHVFGLPYRGHFGWPVAKLPPEGECFAPCAAAALYRREKFLELGGFDERFFCYGEDVDLGFRLRLAGGRAVQAREARVAHEGSGVTGRRSDFSVYHGHRNRIWTYFKNMPGAILWPMLPFHLVVNAALMLRYAPFAETREAYWRAMIDGFAGLQPFMNERRAGRALRRARLLEIAKALTWSPLKAVRREATIRRIARGAAK